MFTTIMFVVVIGLTILISDNDSLSALRQKVLDAAATIQQERAIDNDKTIITTNTIINNATTTSSCQRICPLARPNRIYLFMGTAGLSDRLAVLQMISKFAGYLCAVVDLPPPSAALIDIHNGGKSLNKHLKWEDFFNFTFVQDGSPVFYEGQQNPNRSQHHKEWSDRGFYDPTKYPNYKVLISNRSDNLLEHYAMIQEWSWQFEGFPDRGFLWEIHQSMYSSKLRRAKPLPSLSNSTAQSLASQKYKDEMRPTRACEYVNGANEQIEPAQLHALRQELQHRVRIRAPNNTDMFGFVHIRRTDAKKECNTDIKEMSQFFHCSLNDTLSTGKQITLLMASDEKDQGYRQSILDLINQDFDRYPHVTMLDADAIVREMMASADMPKRLLNNYYQFELLKGIGMLKSFDFSTIYLTKRRKDCKPCVNLVAKYPDAFQ